MARCLLELGPLPPAGQLLTLLLRRRQAVHPDHAAQLPPLYDVLVARQPLTCAEWSMVPTPCPGLGAALPAVLERSADEAALLVRHLPPADSERLRTVALCLVRTQRRCRVALPAEIVSRLLMAAVAE